VLKPKAAQLNKPQAQGKQRTNKQMKIEPKADLT
jgi:hypothetical protein